MTLPWAIYVRSDVLVGDRTALARLLRHELVHVRQWAEFGAIGFIRRYLGAYVAGRRSGMSHDAAYRAIPLEREAQEVVGE